MSKMLIFLYRFIRFRSLIEKVLRKTERGEMHSTTLRMIFEKYYDLRIGKYSYGGCFKHFHFDRSIVIGNYCSIANTAYAFTRNHPVSFISTHPFFYNDELNIVSTEKIKRTKLTIGHDVWLGHNTIILPRVNNIGNGAVVAAGAVVVDDIPPYAIVAGNPATVIKFRFDDKTIESLQKSQWWNKDIIEIEKKFLNHFTTELADYKILDIIHQ